MAFRTSNFFSSSIPTHVKTQNKEVTNHEKWRTTSITISPLSNNSSWPGGSKWPNLTWLDLGLGKGVSTGGVGRPWQRGGWKDSLNLQTVTFQGGGGVGFTQKELGLRSIRLKSRPGRSVLASRGLLQVQGRRQPNKQPSKSRESNRMKKKNKAIKKWCYKVWNEKKIGLEKKERRKPGCKERKRKSWKEEEVVKTGSRNQDDFRRKWSTGVNEGKVETIYYLWILSHMRPTSSKGVHYDKIPKSTKYPTK